MGLKLGLGELAEGLAERELTVRDLLDFARMFNQWIADRIAIAPCSHDGTMHTETFGGGTICELCNRYITPSGGQHRG